MITRTYECIACRVAYEFEQRITDGPLKSCTYCKDPKCVPKRLINCEGALHFIAGDSGGWSSTGYSKPLNQRRAEQTLGRKLRKSE